MARPVCSHIMGDLSRSCKLMNTLLCSCRTIPLSREHMGASRNGQVTEIGLSLTQELPLVLRKVMAGEYWKLVR